jgi:phytoene dehydrogenase-like protein
MADNRYDVTIIGSGIGGLTAAALLSKWGLRVLVLEKRDRLGGRCATVEYEGFRLPTGAITIHQDSAMNEAMQEAGVVFETVPVSRLFYRLEGRDHEMPSKGSIATLLDIVNNLEVQKGRLLTGMAKAVATEAIMGGFKQTIAEGGKGNLTFHDWILQYTDNELALSIFDCIASTLLGGHSYEIPASAAFAIFARARGFREVGITPRGNGTEMEKLATVVRAGGDIWTGSAASGIGLKSGRARLVEVMRNGAKTTVESEAVISNIGPKGTALLVGEHNLKDDYLRAMRLGLRPKPVTLAFIASDRPLWPEDGRPAILMIAGTRRVTTLVPISSVQDNAAPPGQHLLFAFGSPKSSWAHIDKEEEVSSVMRDLREQLPGFEQHGRLLKIEPRDISDDFPEARVRLGFNLPPETPVPNLFNVGCAVLPPGIGGVAAIVAIAREVAVKIRRLVKG